MLFYFNDLTDMKKLLFLIILLLPLSVYAQNEALVSENSTLPTLVERILDRRDSLKNASYKIRKIHSHINLEFYTSGNAYFSDGKFDELSFRTSRVRLEIYGRLNDHLSYHFRQSFNRYSNPYSVDNLASSIEYANITWHASERFELVAGKQFVALGGYEAYLNALRIRQFSEFNNNVEVYQSGVMGVLNFNPDHQLILQLVNNRSGSDSDLFVYGLPSGVESAKVPLLATANWNGYFIDRSLQFRYSASVGQLAKGNNIYYLTCGNIYEKGPLLAYLDVMYSREGIDSQQRITMLQSQSRGMLPQTARNTQYLSLIANVDYQFHPKWNMYVKGAYETASVYKANGFFNQGRFMTNWNAQACVEWFPFTEDKGFRVFAHYLYKGNILTRNAAVLMAEMPDTQRIELGVVYVIPVL